MADEPKPVASAVASAVVAAGALLPGLLTVYFSFRSGGYFPGAPALVAAQLAGLIALRLVLVRRPLEGVSPGVLVAAAALAAYTAWVLASSGWSESPARAIPEYTRALAYLLAFVLFGILPFSVRRVRWLVCGVAGAIVLVSAFAFISRTMPDLVAGAGALQPDRLSYPLDYWNALGLLAGLGIILCGHLACASSEHWALRVAGAAAVPLLTATLYYTFSRGTSWATVAGVVLYVVVGRPRGLLAGAIATVPATVLALMTVNPAGRLTDGPRFAPETIAAGHRTAIAVLACVLGAAALRALLLPLDSRVDATHLTPRLRRPLLIGATVATITLVLGLSAAFHVPEVVADKYKDFSSDGARVGDSGASRLLSGSDNGRRSHWQVALDAYESDKLRGGGAGTYAVAWARNRDSAVEARDGHSLYLETLAELGLVGLGLLAIFLLALLVGFAARTRGGDRPLFAALLSAAAAWVIAAGVDWAWEMPAVTFWLFALGGAALARRRPESRAAERVGISGRPTQTGRIALRALGVAACLGVAVLPARLAVSEAHFERSVESLRAGDCTTASAEAEDALKALDSRAAPHHVVAWCDLQADRDAAAASELSRGLRHDPDNWSLTQALALARGYSGLDPRAAAERAAALNPLGAPTVSTRDALSGETPRSWRRAAAGLEVTMPESGDP